MGVARYTNTARDSRRMLASNVEASNRLHCRRRTRRSVGEATPTLLTPQSRQQHAILDEPGLVPAVKLNLDRMKGLIATSSFIAAVLAHLRQRGWLVPAARGGGVGPTSLLLWKLRTGNDPS